MSMEQLGMIRRLEERVKALEDLMAILTNPPPKRQTLTLPKAERKE